MTDLRSVDLDNLAERTGIRVEFYDPLGTRYGFPTFPYHCAPTGLATLRQLRAAGLRPGGHDPVAQIYWRHRTNRRVAYLYRTRPRQGEAHRYPRPAGGHRQSPARPPHLPALRPGEALLHPPPLRLLPRLPRRPLMTTTTPASAGTRLEGLVLVLILIAVGGSAGAASFTHVHDWTMANSPANTPGWFGWANAVISELVPIAALLTIRRRRRTGAPIGYPMVLLIAAAGLSLAAQLAVAKPGPSGWLLSAVPALAFMALVKLVLAPAPTAQPMTATL